MEDFNEALKNVKPSVGKGDLTEYEKWMLEFGEQGTNWSLYDFDMLHYLYIK